MLGHARAVYMPLHKLGTVDAWTCKSSIHATARVVAVYVNDTKAPTMHIAGVLQLFACGLLAFFLFGHLVLLVIWICIC